MCSQLWQPELAACQATCLGDVLQRSLPEAFNQEVYCLGGRGQCEGDGRRTVGLFTLGRQEALLGTA